MPARRFYDTICLLGALRATKTFTHPLDLLGIVAPNFAPQLEDRLRGLLAVRFGDNMAVKWAATKSCSSAPDMAFILNGF